MIDTHCHLTFDHFDGRVDALLDDAAAAGVRGVITVATTSAGCREVLALAETHDNVWCTAGVHPLYSDNAIDWDTVREVAGHPRCVAWGELGLDNHYDRPPRADQDRVLEEQLGVIESSRGDGLEQPVVVHCREAFDELLATFRRTRLDPERVRRAPLAAGRPPA